jgi:hypothetical protein
VADDRYPQDAVDFVRSLPPELALRGPMLNDFGLGGYIIFELPEHPVFIDGRNDIVYPQPFIRAYLDAWSDPAKFERLANEHDVQWLFLDARPDDAGRFFIDVSGRWVPVHVDDAGVIYVRRGGVNDALARARGYRLLRPYALTASLKSAAADQSKRELVLHEARRLVQDDPDSVNAHVALARLYVLMGEGYEDDLQREVAWLRDRGLDV